MPNDQPSIGYSNHQVEYAYDAHLSVAKHDDDETWAYGWLLPRLEDAGLKICTVHDFDIGVATVINVNRTLKASRCTLIVLTPRWVEDQWEAFTGIQALSSDPTTLDGQLMPLLLQPCEPPPHIANLTSATFTNQADWETELKRVIAVIRGRRSLASEADTLASSKQRQNIHRTRTVDPRTSPRPQPS